jgi:hypothetical protein
MGWKRPIRQLNRHYRSNKAFSRWVKANEEWFRKNPDAFREVVRDRNMVNLFMQMMLTHEPVIEKRLHRLKGRSR